MSMSAGTIAYIGVGANVGDRAGNIAAAIEQLRATPNVKVTRVSTLIENDAVGGATDTPRFLNGVVELRTTLSPQELLARMMEIERDLGRERRYKWAPRTIDLDLVLFGDAIVAEPGLHVPHVLMHERRFVLEPLCQIAPDALHPAMRLTVRQMLEKLP